MSDVQYEYTDRDPELEKMLDTQVPWADVPETNVLPEQLFNWFIEDVYGARTNPGEEGIEKAKINLILVAEAPEDYKGRYLTAGFIVGTDRDPLAQDIQTWINPGLMSGFAADLQKLQKKLQCSNWRELKGKRFSAFIRNNPDRTNPGRIYSNLQTSMFYTVGEVLPGTLSTAGGGRRRVISPQRSNGPSQTQSMTASCPQCQKEFPTADIVEHVKQCQG